MSDTDNHDASAPVVSEPRKRGRPTKHGKAMSNNERQKRRQQLLNSVFDGFIQLAGFVSYEKHGPVYSRRNNYFPGDYSGFDYREFLKKHIPEELRKDFHSKVQDEIAKNCYAIDRKKFIDVKEGRASPIHRSYHITDIIKNYCDIEFFRNRPLKNYLERIKFMDDFESFHEDAYVDLYKKYRDMEPEIDEKRNKQSELLKQFHNTDGMTQSEKSAHTRLKNMREYIMNYEKERLFKEHNLEMLKTNNEQSSLLHEESVALAFNLNDEDLKARYKELQNIVNNKNNINIVRSDEIVINEKSELTVENVVSEATIMNHDFSKYSDEMISAIKVLSDINDIKVDKSEPKPTEFTDDDAGLILLSTFDMYFIQNANASQGFKRRAMKFWETIESIKIKISIIRPKNQTDYALRVRQYLRNKSINDIHEINKLVSVIPSNSTKLTKDDLKEFERWYINYVNNKNIKEGKRDALGELIIIPDFDD